MDSSDQAPVREGSNQRREGARVKYRLDEILDELRESIEREVAVGLLTEHEIVSQNVAKFMELAFTDGTRATIEREPFRIVLSRWPGEPPKVDPMYGRRRRRLRHASASRS